MAHGEVSEIIFLTPRSVFRIEKSHAAGTSRHRRDTNLQYQPARRVVRRRAWYHALKT